MQLRSIGPAILTVCSLVSCGPKTVAVESRGCEPTFTRYNDVQGAKLLGYDRDNDSHIDEVVQATAGRDTPITQDYLSTLPTQYWTHRVDEQVRSPACWVTENTRGMTSHQQQEYDRAYERFLLDRQ